MCDRMIEKDIIFNNIVLVSISSEHVSISNSLSKQAKREGNNEKKATEKYTPCTGRICATNFPKLTLNRKRKWNDDFMN